MTESEEDQLAEAEHRLFIEEYAKQRSDEKEKERVECAVKLKAYIENDKYTPTYIIRRAQYTALDLTQFHFVTETVWRHG